MLVNSKKILLEFKEKKKALFQFNINNLEWAKAILEECDKLHVPVILGVSESAVTYMGGYSVVFSLVSNLIEDLKIKTAVCLHLDHGHSLESCLKAIDSGFTSVMIDLSQEDFSRNILVTKQLVEYAKPRNVTVEAELGAIGKIENDKLLLGNTTNVEDCIKFVEKTKVDALAPSVGTVHGIYKGKLNIDYNLIRKISQSISIPLVLHGGSGLSNDILKKCIESGITKININSDLQDAWSKSVRNYLKENNDVIDPRKIIQSGIDSLKQEIEFKMNINK